MGVRDSTSNPIIKMLQITLTINILLNFDNNILKINIESFILLIIVNILSMRI